MFRDVPCSWFYRRPFNSTFAFKAFNIHVKLLNSVFTGNFQAYSLIYKSIIVFRLEFSAGSTNISTRVPIYQWFYRKQTPRDRQLIRIFSLMNRNSEHFHCCSVVLAYSFMSLLQITLPSTQLWPSLDTGLFK